MTDEIKPFRINVPDDLWDDLKQRLANTRWPEAELVDDWSQGIPLSYVQDVCNYWADGYDWRAREEALNRFDQFTTEVDGLDVHFVHVRSPTRTPCRSSSPTAGRARSWSSTRSSNR